VSPGSVGKTKRVFGITFKAVETTTPAATTSAYGVETTPVTRNWTSLFPEVKHPMSAIKITQMMINKRLENRGYRGKNKKPALRRFLRDND
jgi:hypothetical protein